MTAHASIVVPAPPDVVFTTVTDIARLPAWNAVMSGVVEQPPVLATGAEWVVAFHALGQTWRSRSTVEELDVAGRRFVYRSATDDGNPSHAQWAWTVTDHPAGSCVTVRWTLHPVTFWRRVLLAQVRSRQLARTEVPASLSALTALVTADETA